MQNKKTENITKLVYEKFYVHEIAAVNFSKINGLKNTEKTCKLNNRDLYHDRKRKTITISTNANCTY